MNSTRMSGAPIVPAKLARLRLEKAWSRQQLADRAGVSLKSLAAYETGNRHPRADAFHRLAEALGCQPADLLE
jgi:transcriptional regulator with XRE-family HTH domain